MAIEIFRHGARHPIHYVYKSDQLNHTLQGELTPIGERQQFLLGQALRKKYIEQQQLISKEYDPSQIYIRSTDFNRTIQSAQAQLQGLFNANGKQLSDKEIKNAIPPFDSLYLPENLNMFGFSSLPHNIATIPIHTIPIEQDELLLSSSSGCPNYQYYENLQLQNTSYLNLLSDYLNNTFNIISQVANIQREEMSIYKVGQLMDQLSYHYIQGEKIDQQLLNLFPIMEIIQSLNLVYTTYGSEIQKKSQNRQIFQYILEKFQNNIKNFNDNLKLILLSAHDITIQQILVGLNLTSLECIYQNLQIINNETFINMESNNIEQNKFINNIKQNELQKQCIVSYPLYASNIIFELHYNERKNFLAKTNQNYYVTILYQGKIINDFSNISFEKFEQFLQNYLQKSIDNYEYYCYGNQSNNNYKVELEELKLKEKQLQIIIILLVALFVILAYLVLKQNITIQKQKVKYFKI